VRYRQGRLFGRINGLGFQFRAEAVLHTLTEDVIRSSEIEGGKFERDQVRSSIARRLGLDIGGLTAADRNVEGVVEIMLNATQGYEKPLTARRRIDWHAALSPTGRTGMTKIKRGRLAR
jgi:Fic family protein